MLGQLVPCGGGPPLPLLKPRMVVGRHEDCDIRTRFATISGRHCALELRDGYWFVRDLGSSNGTRINGVLCLEQWLLPGDILNLAGLRFNVVYDPPADRPPPERLGIEAAPKAAAAPQDHAPKPAASGSDNGLLGELLPCGGGTPIPLRRPKLIVGRRPECDITIAVGVVSGQHCELEFKDGHWHVRDLNSRHGTRVDGAPVESKILLPGNILWIANQRFKVAYTAPGSPPPAARGSMFARSLLEAAGLARWQPPSPRGEEKDDPHRERHRIDE